MTERELTISFNRIVGQARFDAVPYALEKPSIVDLEEMNRVQFPVNYWALTTRRPPAYVWTGPRPRLQLEQVHLLRTLSAALNQHDRTVLVSIALRAASFGLFSEGMQCLAHILLELAPSRVSEVGSQTTYERLAVFWQAVRTKLAFESYRFGNEEMGAIVEAASSSFTQVSEEYYPPGKKPELSRTQALDAMCYTAATVERVRYLRLARQIRERHEPLLEAHQDELRSRLQALGLPSALDQALRAVEQQAREGSSALDFKQCMDVLRSVLQTLLEASACRVAVLLDREFEPSSGPRTFAPTYQFLIGRKVLSEHEGAVLQSLWNFCHRREHTVSEARPSRSLWLAQR